VDLDIEARIWLHTIGEHARVARDRPDAAAMLGRNDVLAWCGITLTRPNTGWWPTNHLVARVTVAAGLSRSHAVSDNGPSPPSRDQAVVHEHT